MLATDTELVRRAQVTDFFMSSSVAINLHLSTNFFILEI